MAIEKNAGGGGGSYIKEAGEYRVQVENVEFGKSSKGDPMATITFTTDDGAKIRDYFLRDKAFAQKRLGRLKEACGLRESDSSDKLVGHRCGIAVEMDEPNEKGMIFARIVGYGKETDVEAVPESKDTFNNPKDQIPF